MPEGCMQGAKNLSLLSLINVQMRFIYTLEIKKKKKRKILLACLGDLQTMLLHFNHSNLGRLSEWYVNNGHIRTFSKAQCFVFDLLEAFNDQYVVRRHNHRYIVTHLKDSIRSLFSFAVNLQFGNFQRLYFLRQFSLPWDNFPYSPPTFNVICHGRTQTFFHVCLLCVFCGLQGISFN